MACSSDGRWWEILGLREGCKQFCGRTLAQGVLSLSGGTEAERERDVRDCGLLPSEKVTVVTLACAYTHTIFTQTQ